MPSPLAKFTDTLTHDNQAAADAALGLFRYGQTYVTSFNGVSDCPSNGQSTCPYFERVKISADGKLASSKFAYYPIQKKWVALAGGGVGIGFSTADTVFDGKKWSTNFPVLVPKTQSQSVGPWSYNYGTGSIEYQLNLSSSSLAGKLIGGAQGIQFPSDAKSINMVFEQVSGVLYTLSKGGFWQESDDGAVYPNTASLRAAHTTTSSPLCLAKFDVKSLVYFDPQVHAAGFASEAGICNSSIQNFDKITPVESGAITLDGRSVIALQIPDNAFSFNPSNRKKQVVALVGLNSVGGNAAHGLAYFPGYVHTSFEYQNLSAFMAWLNTVTTDVEAQTLP